MPRFTLGHIVITTDALNFCNEHAVDYTTYLVRHSHCDWGDLDEHDLQENEFALNNGFRLFSSYDLPEELGKLWVITEFDRSVTTILLPEDY